MAKKVSSKFDVADGLFSDLGLNQGLDVQTKNTEEKSIVTEKQDETKKTQETEIKETGQAKLNIGDTQGRKGVKLKRINMAFSDDNYEYIRFESRRRGLSITQFVNQIIDEYKAKEENHIKL